MNFFNFFQKSMFFPSNPHDIRAYFRPESRIISAFADIFTIILAFIMIFGSNPQIQKI